jgi:hypothetical protein
MQVNYEIQEFKNKTMNERMKQPEINGYEDAPEGRGICVFFIILLAIGITGIVLMLLN